MRISPTGLHLPPLKGLPSLESFQQKTYLLKRRFTFFPPGMISAIRIHLRGVEEDEPNRMPISVLWAKYARQFRLGTEAITSYHERMIARARKFDKNSGEHLQYASACIDKVRDYETELDTLDKEELDRRYREQIERDAQERKADSEKYDRLRFFNRPSAAVDYGYWSEQHYWTAEEAAALSFDKDPRKVNDKTLGAIEGSDFVDRYFERRQVIERAIKAGALDRVSERKKYIAWAKKTKIGQFDPRLMSPTTNGAARGLEENPKSLRVLGDALLGALLYHYLLDSKAEQNRVAAKAGGADEVSIFCANIGKAGIVVGERTLRKHLKDAIGRMEATKPPKGKMQDKLNAIKKQLLTADEAERG